MSAAFLTLSPNLAFGKLELRRADGSVEGEIPSWLVDRPDVLKALTLIATGTPKGTAFLRRVPDNHEVLVDIGDRGVFTREIAW
jgi:hypothetical protein